MSPESIKIRDEFEAKLDYWRLPYSTGFNQGYVQGRKELEDELNRHKELLRKAVEGLKYYADKGNWWSQLGEDGFTAIDDKEDGELMDIAHEEKQQLVGGKLARETLLRLKKEEGAE